MRLFEIDNVELEFTQDACEAMADLALARGTGARGLRSIIEEILLEVQFELPSRRDVKKCVVTKETIERGLKLEGVLPGGLGLARRRLPAAPARRQRPNPCLGPLLRPPFLAFSLVPGDLGTKGGLRTDELGERWPFSRNRFARIS